MAASGRTSWMRSHLRLARRESGLETLERALRRAYMLDWLVAPRLLYHHCFPHGGTGFLANLVGVCCRVLAHGLGLRWKSTRRYARRVPQYDRAQRWTTRGCTHWRSSRTSAHISIWTWAKCKGGQWRVRIQCRLELEGSRLQAPGSMRAPGSWILETRILHKWWGNANGVCKGEWLREGRQCTGAETSSSRIRTSGLGSVCGAGKSKLSGPQPPSYSWMPINLSFAACDSVLVLRRA